MELGSSLVDQEELSVALIFEDVELEAGDFNVMSPDNSIDLLVLILEIIDVQLALHVKRYVYTIRKMIKQINRNLTSINGDDGLDPTNIFHLKKLYLLITMKKKMAKQEQSDSS